MTLPLDSPTAILYKLSVENFRLCLTVQKLFVCIYLADNLASRFQNLRFSVVLTPRCNLLRDPQKALSYSKSRRLSHVRANRLSGLGYRGIQEKNE
jgi:hypothetical protein